MQNQADEIFIGNTRQKPKDKVVQGKYIQLMGEPFYRITNYDAIEPFFISLVSSSDHWLFIATTGGLTAGRVDPERALFPYYTVDKITENSENTGAKTILLVTRDGIRHLWEPFSTGMEGLYAIQRNLYKNIAGTALVFEEVNNSLGLRFRYAWRTSEKFGFIKSSWLENLNEKGCAIDILDGVQNLLPAFVTTLVQDTFGSLLDAYKLNQLEPASGLAIYALNATLTDLPEPSESLLATTAVQIGLRPTEILLSSLQLDQFRAGLPVTTEHEVRGRRGAFLARDHVDLPAGEQSAWHLLLDVEQDSAAIVKRLEWLKGDPDQLVAEVESDITANQQALWSLDAQADGLQQTQDRLVSASHFANAMFNIMRGGIFTACPYEIKKADLLEFVAYHNREVLREQAGFFGGLPDQLDIHDLQQRAETTGSPDLVRLCSQYLPLTFSRRHGDPSRPWNRFAINIKKPDGSLKIDYEGNWRDIFQNWEALAYSFPEFIESMISNFLNATTADGYNPYRITHQGLDWEIPEPGNPWANIGYWSDHQVIYLQKLMEISARVHPGRLEGLLDRALFSTANVPYRIKPYAGLLTDPYHTIDFDWDLEKQIEARTKAIGTDGKLLLGADGHVLRFSLAEKLLTLLLAKLANFVPEGGIWMSTQRPEWNDANNALVGKGLSVVTLCAMRRMVPFWLDLLRKAEVTSIPVSAEIERFFRQVDNTLNRFKPGLLGSFDDRTRRDVMDCLGEAGSDYRWEIYQHGYSGEMADLPTGDLVSFLELVQEIIDYTLRLNLRPDGLYHSYNTLHLSEGCARIGRLYEMLEGQAAILSSGFLSETESLVLLDRLRQSALYQPETQTYILYPDRQIPAFLEKNHIPQVQAEGIELFKKLAEAQDRSVVTRDIHGDYHFSGHIHNVNDVNRRLDELKTQPEYAGLVEAEADQIRALFEATFHHDAFTGRSGTFFAYEGLGSVYWHMVAKLLLAAGETALRFKDGPNAGAFDDHYRDIRRGLSFNKTPAEYGAFPTDPYSHTPKGQGAKQPGMTGAVKEILLARQAELGWKIEDGRLVFDRTLFDPEELLGEADSFKYLNVAGATEEIELEVSSLAYTICQTPVILKLADEAKILVYYSNGAVIQIQGNSLDLDNSRHIFLRDGVIHHISVSIVL